MALAAVAVTSFTGAVAAAAFSTWTAPEKLDEIAGNSADINTA